MSVTYQVERWTDCWQEMAKLWDHYWLEVRGSQESTRIDPNHTVYETFEGLDQLQIVTVRNDEHEMVGFHITTISYHHHHKTVLCGFFDAWYVIPEYRKGLIGYKLLRVVEDHLRTRGVERLYGGNSLQNDVSLLLERQGWEQVEVLFTKRLKD